MVDEYNLPRITKPKHIPLGVSWTTKESSDLSDAISELMRSMTREEVIDATEGFDAYRERKEILNKQYKFVDQLEASIANLCMAFEKETGAYIQGISLNRQYKHVEYEQEDGTFKQGNLKMLSVQVRVPSEYLVTQYDWHKNNESDE